MRGVIVSIMPESSLFNECLYSIFEMDIVFSQVSMTLMILAVFASISHGLSRSRERTFDVAVLEISISTLHQDALVGSCQWSVLSKSPCAPSLFARIPWFVIPPLLARSSRRARILLSRIAG